MAEIKIITTKELEEKIEAGEKLEIVDVREYEEVRYGIIEGAKHIPMGDIPARLAEFDKDKEYIFVCRSGNRSGNVCYFMNQQGFKSVNMIGGMLDWTGEVIVK